MSDTDTRDRPAPGSGCDTVDDIGDKPDKDWDQFEACERCHGRADVDETPDGDLVCAICHAKLPRPSS